MYGKKNPRGKLKIKLILNGNFFTITEPTLILYLKD